MRNKYRSSNRITATLTGQRTKVRGKVNAGLAVTVVLVGHVLRIRERQTLKVVRRSYSLAISSSNKSDYNYTI